MDPATPPPPSSSATSLPILAIAILGILTTAFLLVSYYLFAMKCGINWRRSDLLLRRLSSTWSRRHRPSLAIFTAADGGHGLDLSAIRSIPIIRFTRAGATEAQRGQSFHECAVCLNEFQEEEKLRLLPNCFHIFHIDCIDTWLQTNTNCPLCRSDITSPLPMPLTEQGIAQTPLQERSGSHVVIDVRGGPGSEQNPRSGEAPSPSPRKWEQLRKKGRKFHRSATTSMGDECIDVREKDEQFCVQPIRRSLSMDSSNDRQLYLSVQEILKQNPHFVREARDHEVGNGEGSSSCGGGGAGSASGRIRRSLFSFGLGRSSRSAVLPLQIDP